MLELHAYLYNLIWKQNKNKYLSPSSNKCAGHVQLESKRGGGGGGGGGNWKKNKLEPESIKRELPTPYFCSMLTETWLSRGINRLPKLVVIRQYIQLFDSEQWFLQQKN